MKEAPGRNLFNSEIDKQNQQILLEQYKIYIESANLTSTLRSQTNTFFLTINTALVSFAAAIPQFSNQAGISRWILFAFIAGILLDLSWFFAIRSYRSLNSGRFAVIHEIESKLPARIYQREWEIVTKQRPDKSKYIRQTLIEQISPILFAALYIAMIASQVFAG